MNQQEWIQAAVNHFFKLSVFAAEEAAEAFELAEGLWDNSDNHLHDHAPWISPEDAVDEELTYWGD